MLFRSLTKIPEMLAAGIPVIANRIAARSASHFSGVYIYDSLEELHDLLNKQFGEITIPSLSKNVEARFVRAILANQ